MPKFLIIQTAFIGDVILATPVVEVLAALYPDAKIDFLVRKGNESLLNNNPHINEVLAWDKKQSKYIHLLSLLKTIRTRHYDTVINLQRFAASGFLTGFSGAGIKAGFDKNPFSFLFTHKLKHEIANGKHEVERNLEVIYSLPFAGKETSKPVLKPKLYPSATDHEAVQQYKTSPYLCIAPASVWFTKQYPVEKWVEFIQQIPKHYTIHLLGATSDSTFCDVLIKRSGRVGIYNLCGKLTFLQSAALMQDSVMNYVNDSAPMHIASAMNAPTAAIFCSTVPTFGFGPLSTHSYIIEIKEELSCRPCGLHGYKACPLGHFKCAYSINTQQLLNVLS